jgi:uncharacterized short protein YbdD (DUF466 family)
VVMPRNKGSTLRTLELINQCWMGMRELTGDDAYERYLKHWREHHSLEGGEPLGRKAFFKQELERKWSGVRRCC